MTNFCHIAKGYDTHADVQRDILEWAAPFINFAYQADILEMGSGTGLFTEHLLKKQAHNIVATDISPGMLEVCHQKFLQDARVTCRLMNAWTPDIHGYTGVYSSNLLQWAEDPLTVVSHWSRCLKKEGGHIHAVFFIEKTLSELREVLPEYLLPVQWRSREFWDNVFKEAGLKIRFSRDETRAHWYGNSFELFQMFKETGVNARNRLSSGVLKRALKEYQEKFGFNGRVKSTWHYYQIEAYL